MFRSFRCALLLGITVCLSGWLTAADLDKQCARGAEKPLLQQSIFAHGFMHGYEDGFRMADSDYQIGRRPRAIETTAQYKRAVLSSSKRAGSRSLKTCVPQLAR